jgi:diguanylate cyclase (GGDEF)-like protein
MTHPPRALETEAKTRLEQLRPLLLLSGFGLLALALAVALAGAVLTRSFQSIEISNTLQKATQLYQAFMTDTHQLGIADRDYAEWDDAVRYVATLDPKFISANVTRETLGTLHVDLVWIVGADGREIYSGLLDRHTNVLASPAPAALVSQFRGFVASAGAPDQTQATEHIVQTSLGLTVVAARRISQTDRTRPTDAVMLFARFVGSEDLARISQTSQLKVSLISVAADDPNFSALPPSVLKWVRSSGNSTAYAIAKSRSDISGYALVRDLDDRPLALLSTDQPRDLYALGYRTTWWLLGSIAVLSLAFATSMLVLILRLRDSFRAHENAQRRLARISGQMQELILLVDANTLEIVDANDALVRMIKLGPGELHRRYLSDIFPDLEIRQLAEQAAARGAGQLLASRLARGTEPPVPVELGVTSLEEDGRSLFCLVGTDVTHRQLAAEQYRENERKLFHIAQHDSLTGLPNRLYLHARLPRVLRKAAAGNGLVAVIYLDVDNFKTINDSRGHSAGDRLLRVVAKRLRACVSVQDVVARLGGDEFVIVATLLPDVQAIDNLAGRIQAAMQAPIAIDGESVNVSVSMGIALYPDHGIDMETVLKHADIALYQAKEAGKRCHQIFSAEMNLRVSEAAALEQSLRDALGTSEIYIEYQPVIDLHSGLVASMEALVRWRHPELGIIPPSQFIPLAEQTGMILEIGKQTLSMVLADLRSWLDAGVPIVPVAVNVSAYQLERSDFVTTFANLASQAAVEPRWVCFEITESVMLKEPERVIRTLGRLRANGSRVLIDDFGTGYSGLSYLNRLPIDTIKIDRAFIRDLSTDPTRLPIVHAVIEMCRTLGLSVVAEGVETLEQLQILTEQGCNYAQGFFLSRPVAPRHCRSLLEQLRGTRPLTETVMTRALAAS